MREYLRLHKLKRFRPGNLFNFANYHVGYCLMVEGDLDEAEKFLKIALKFAP
jgi:hypothetical protein